MEMTDSILTSIRGHHQSFYTAVRLRSVPISPRALWPLISSSHRHPTTSCPNHHAGGHAPSSAARQGALHTRVREPRSGDRARAERGHRAGASAQAPMTERSDVPT